MTNPQCSPRQSGRSSSGGTQLPPVIKRYDNIIKSPEDRRDYRGLELSNRMKVLLVSDPNTDKSAAAIDVNVGYMSDPEELPGLAHFCEHMLFLGTKKYPEENGYAKFLAEHGGSSNASTTTDHTMYYFDVMPEHLEKSLDIFSQFFISPLFTESASGRELSAVNSEHEKNTSSDSWRLEQLNRSTSDPRHPFSKFGTGNQDTLERIPKEKGIDVREALLKFHSEWYSANIMTLVVFGKENLDQLEEMVVPLFSGIEDKDVVLPVWDSHPVTPECCRKRLYCEPVKDLRSLSIDFPIPDTREDYKSLPALYLSHLMGHEGDGSLLSALKAKGWCNSLVGGTRLGGRGFGFFGVQVDLTEDSMDHTDEIVNMVFQYIAMLRAEGIQRWVWEELRDTMAMEFRFRDVLEPRTFVTLHVHFLQEFPMEDILTIYGLMSDWRPDLIEELLTKLTPENARIAVVSKSFKKKCTLTEPWYGTKYFIEDIEQTKIDEWKNAVATKDLHLPSPNEFIPARLELETSEDPTTDSLAPIILKDTPFIRLWFKRDNEFRLPKAFISFDLVSPLAYADPISCNLTTTWVLLLRDSLQQLVYTAELAGLRWSLSNAKHGLTIALEGYDDKQHVLLEKIVDHIVNFKADPQRFAIMKENYIRSIKNFEAEQPYQHAVYHQALCLTDHVWTKTQLLESAEDMTCELLDDFAHRMIRKVHIEGLMYGNLTRERALKIIDTIEAKLPKDGRPLLAQQLLLMRELELGNGAWFARSVRNGVHASSCAATYYACGARSARANVTLELLAHALHEPCFNRLRTKEQLGYIVFSGVRRAGGVQGLRLLVQGEKHPRYVEGRIEAFLRAAQKDLKKMTEEEFLKHRASLAAQRLEKPKRLAGKASRAWGEICSQMYNFDRARIEVEELNTLTKQEVIDYFEKYISQDSAERQKLSVHIVSAARWGEDDDQFEEKDAISDKDAIEREPVMITDLVDFKSTRKLYPTATPFINIPRKGAQCKL